VNRPKGRIQYSENDEILDLEINNLHINLLKYVNCDYRSFCGLEKSANCFRGRSEEDLDENWREEQTIVTWLMSWRGYKIGRTCNTHLGK
jgi:hypothetical protein